MRQPTEAEARHVTYTNTRSTRDVVLWFPVLGRWAWEFSHRDGLKSYVGDDGTEIQIMWEDDTPTAYWDKPAVMFPRGVVT